MSRAPTRATTATGAPSRCWMWTGTGGSSAGASPPRGGAGIPSLPWLARDWPVVHEEILAAVERDEARGLPVRGQLRLLTGRLVCPELDEAAARWRRVYRDLLVHQDGERRFTSGRRPEPR